MSFSKLLKNTVTVSRKSVSKSYLGGRSGTPTEIATGVACKIDSLNERSEIQAPGFVTDASHVMFVGYRVDFKQGDYVLDENSNNYTIVYIDNTIPNDHHTEVYLRIGAAK